MRERIRPVSKLLKHLYEVPDLMSVESSAEFIEMVKNRCRCFGFKAVASMCGYTGTFS